jgi:ATP-dependent DNA helicase RecG
VQKKEPISKDAVAYLRKLGVIEGRIPNVYISAAVAEGKDEKAQYIKNKAFDDAHYRQLIIDYLKQFGKASRADIRSLLFDKHSDVLSTNQKEHKVKNILYSMSKKGVIMLDSKNNRTSNWILK